MNHILLNRCIRILHNPCIIIRFKLLLRSLCHSRLKTSINNGKLSTGVGGTRSTSIIFNYVDPRHCCNKFWRLLTGGLSDWRIGSECTSKHVKPFDNCLPSAKYQMSKKFKVLGFWSKMLIVSNMVAQWINLSIIILQL